MSKQYLITFEDMENLVFREEKNKKNNIYNNNTIKNRKCQDKNKVRIDFYVPKEVKERLKEITKNNNGTQSNIMRLALCNGLLKYERNNMNTNMEIINNDTYNNWLKNPIGEIKG